MTTGLNVSRVVNVTVNLAPIAAAKRNFGTLLILGSTNVIDTTERIREFDGLDAFAEAFGINTPEYEAADLFFSQSPQPQMCYGGRWAQTDTAGLLHGAILTPSQQLITGFQAITSGSMLVTVDGVFYALTGLNFSGANNLNGVASIIQSALQAAGATNAKVIWGALNQRFDVVSGTTGILSTVNYVKAPTAAGKITFALQPANNSTITLNGTVVTFVTGTPTSGQVQIGATLAATLTALAQYLSTAVDTQLSKFDYFADATHLYLVAAAAGTGGNALTIAASSSPASNGTVSGATLTGGSGTDISVLLGLSVVPNNTGANADPPVNGIAAESLVSCIAELADVSSLWYALTTNTATPPADADHLAAAAYIEGSTLSRIYGITTQNTEVLDSTRSDDLCSVLKSLAYSRTLSQYCSSNAYAVNSLIGRFATINYEGQNTVITGKFKQEPGVAPEFLRVSYADTLEAKNCNVFVEYDNDTAIIEQAVMANGYFIDERITADWYQNALQVDLYNIFYQSFTKIPQTDDGMNILITQCNHTSNRAVTNGWVAPGVWNSDPIGPLGTGDTLKTGYFFTTIPMAQQDQSDREKRKATPIQGAVKLAGAIHSVDCAVLVNR